MTMNELTPVYAASDDSGNWYVFPLTLKEKFFELLEAFNMSQYDVEEGCDEYYEKQSQIEEDFDNVFSIYETKGDLNNVQLYAPL